MLALVFNLKPLEWMSHNLTHSLTGQFIPCFLLWHGCMYSVVSVCVCAVCKYPMRAIRITLSLCSSFLYLERPSLLMILNYNINHYN